MRKFNIVVKCFSGYSYFLKYRNVAENRFSSMLEYLFKNGHNVSIIFFYDALTKNYLGTWTKKRGYKAK